MTATVRGAIGAGAFALIWVQWGLGAALFVLVAAVVGAVAVGTLAGEVDVARSVRELQDRT